MTLFISSAKPFSICFLSGSSHSVHSHFNFKRLNSFLQDIYKAGSFHASSLDFFIYFFREERAGSSLCLLVSSVGKVNIREMCLSLKTRASCSICHTDVDALQFNAGSLIMALYHRKAEDFLWYFKHFIKTYLVLNHVLDEFCDAWIWIHP